MMAPEEFYPLPESTTKGANRWKWAVAILGVAVAFLLTVPIFFGVLIWDGSTHCAVSVLVLERNSDFPVENAEVEILGSSEDGMKEILRGSGREEWKRAMKGYDIDVMGETNERGTVVLGAKCGAGGRSSILGGKTGSYSVDHILEVAHPDYEPVRVTLASLLGKDRFPLSKKELAVKVWLIPKTTPPVSSDHAPAPR
jgi:hypothetical protein